MKIILVGGGTGGPVIPLVAVQQKIHKEFPKTKFLFVGTSSGPEKQMLSKYNVAFKGIVSGKLRRYFSVLNIFAPFLVLIGFVQALLIIKKFNPDVVFAAGGYVAVPVVFAAWILRKKIVIHQQDYVPSLTNKILSPFANKITVSFEHSLKDFFSGLGIFGYSKNEQRVHWTGNPFREDLTLDFSETEKKKTRDEFGIQEDMPVLLILGGATGASGLNKIIQEALPELVKISHVIHSTGIGKGISFNHPNYHQYELISNMRGAYALSDIVISRAGMSTITELSALKKAAIIVPMPDSHQTENATILLVLQAALVISQGTLSGERLVDIVRKVMYDWEYQNTIRENIHKLMPHNATEKISKILVDICQK
ncbi:MAG: UDP-N-acetylglucosamine--N-acetylmuramyl-(pentapeptide) pyrophosphoryl-undecaprenol N-acetylglucosamine transferase [Candidatus Doudnabacteria bacterium Gr01-1014_77]|uniref:UDP-N-acetylglucosamine--N-acetylmuramyl-(pentapeptide) pyrophosphoryl-undecaprenol N-acetylglucosamine transferase n=1 Tax=Candidatus Doudnabacteria bacterium Gr01-1014_77 TaxID=2017133 RepID=A0A554JCN2_9BACT|nr:MAG: UDP-N-acetylglucosamine--N-acetylmuramyl-(pentapeptide) pyrophosphoryl-undecaprenol N-acetylglucosamine transferase [Candidatus Doudnabacteria bacterium Gr01-1014_77]